MLRRLATISFVHRRLTLLLWVLAVIGISWAASAVGDRFAQSGRLKGTDSDRAYSLLLAEAPADSNIDGDTVQLVISNVRGIDRAEGGQVDQLLEEIRATPGVRHSPAAIGDLHVSPSSTVATASMSVDPSDELVTDRLLKVRAAAATRGTALEFGGSTFQDGGVPATELFGILAAVVILLISFGSVVAMGLPILTAVFGITVGLGAVQLWAAVVDTPQFTVQVASMVGLGVGIDYALFIVTRYRESLRATNDPLASTLESIDTAGRAVVFAGVTVMISLLGMLLMGVSFLNGLALGTSSAVLVAVLAAVTLLPACFGFLGHRIDRLALHRRAERGGQNVWHRWSRCVQRHPVACAVSGLTLLLALVVPSFAMRMASADAGNDPPGTTTRLAYDALSEGFGPGSNGPLLVVTSLTSDPHAAEKLSELIVRTNGVASIAGIEVAPSGTVAVITVIPTSGPQAAATTDLVHRLRSDVIAGSGIEAHILREAGPSSIRARASASAGRASLRVRQLVRSTFAGCPEIWVRVHRPAPAGMNLQVQVWDQSVAG